MIETFFKRKVRRSPEEDLQMAVCKWLKLQYREVIFSSEASGVNRSKAAAGKAKGLRSGVSLPDLWVLEARGGYFGLLLEFKTRNPYKKGSILRKNPHIQAQAQMLDRLRKKGYKAEFVWDLDTAIMEIRHYVGLPVTVPLL